MKSAVSGLDEAQFGLEGALGYRRGGPRERGAAAVKPVTYLPPRLHAETRETIDVKQESHPSPCESGDHEPGEGSSSQQVIRPRFKAAPISLISSASPNPSTQQPLISAEDAGGDWELA